MLYNYKWVQRNDNSDIGYILDVNLEYPATIYETQKDLLLCPEHVPPPGTKQKKLLITLHYKHRYVLHYRALKQAIK